MSGLILTPVLFTYLHYCKTLSSNTINAPALVIVNAQVQTFMDVHQVHSVHYLIFGFFLTHSEP